MMNALDNEVVSDEDDDNDDDLYSVNDDGKAKEDNDGIRSFIIPTESKN